MTNRKQRVIIGDSGSNWKDLSSSVQQGSVLGTLLLTIFMNDLLDEIKNKCSAAISLRFPDVRENNSGSNVNREVIEMLTLLRNDLATQKEKLASLEAELIEDDEDDEDDENPIIGSLKRNPEVMDGVINMAAMALGKLFNTTKVSALGSIDKIENNEPIDSVSLNNSIEILSKL